jgi:hypothetical protein
VRADAYGYVVNEQAPRHARCECPVPCQMRFDCQSERHRGGRATPFCRGAWGDEPDVCDDCWGTTER